MKKLIPKIRAFTLIELLITIAIIALLTGIVISSLTTPKARSRDLKRISDIGQIQGSMELYFDRCKAYPATLSTLADNSLSGTCSVTFGSYMTVIPTDQNSVSYTYATVAPYNSYVLKATLESYNEVLKDDVDGTVISVDCGTANNGAGTAERIYCLSSL